MPATKLLKNLLFVALLGCASAHAEEATYPGPQEGKATATVLVSDLRCELAEGQLRCTFGG